MSDVQLFDNGEFALRFAPAGESFTVSGPDVARALGFRDAHRMVESIPDTEKGHTLAGTPGGDQRIWYLTEAGFYRAIGQRQPARIRNETVRAQVIRFQNWVYGDVLPSIRRTGGYISAMRGAAGSFYEPHTLTWEEAAALIRQRFGIDMTVNELTRMLRTAGVLKQTGAPRKQWQHLFWFTGSAWTVHTHAVLQVAQKVYDTGRELQDFRFIQMRLQLDGVGTAITTA